MNNFASFTLGQISAPVNILKEFLEIFNRRHKCKAAILSWLDGKHYYGQEWVRITLENLGEILGYCRETISKHLRELVKDQLIDELPSHRFPKDTANMYRLNPNWLPPIEFDKSEWVGLSKVLGFWRYLDMLPKVLFFGRCEKIGLSMPINQPINANNPPTLETNLKLFKNNNTAVAEKKETVEEEEANWEAIATVTQAWEQTQTSHYVDDSTQETGVDDIDSDEDLPSAPEIKVVSNSNSEPTKDKTWISHKREIEGCGECGECGENGRFISSALCNAAPPTPSPSSHTSHTPHTSHTSLPKSVRNSDKTGEDLPSAPEIKVVSNSNSEPTKVEIRDTCAELKRLRINPDPCLGVIKKYWGNVAGAIARVKEAIAEGWCDNPTGLFINSCKSGVKAKTAVTADVKTWYDWAYRQGLVQAMQEGKWVYLPDGSRAALDEMMRRYPMEI
jgi:hypothetical protein